MRGEEYLKKEKQFSLVYSKGRLMRGGLLSIRLMPNSLCISRYGFIVGKRVGKAVVRNRVKRLLRELLRQTPLRPGWDIIFIARSPAARDNYASLGKSVRGLLFRAGLLMGEYEGVCPGTN